MSDPEICRLPAVQLRDRIRAREVSAVEVAEAFLTRIERVNPQLNAICTLAPDIVNQASQVDRQIAAGDIRPLQGVPVGIKMSPRPGGFVPPMVLRSIPTTSLPRMLLWCGV